MQSFTLASDNFSGIHPDVLKAIVEVNKGHAIAYGNDPWTKRAQELFKATFGPQVETFIVFNGTAANVLGLSHLLSPWQAVICSDQAHIWTDECGALSATNGSTLLPTPHQNGKITPESAAKWLHYQGNEHHVQPAVLSITQSTELGTVYTLKEIKRLSDFAKQHNLYFHIDGARIANAAANLNCSLKSLTADLGVDILSFGGTKNGLMGADAIVFFNAKLALDFAFVRKQNLHLASKMRFLSAQFIALLENDLWLRNARHANAMAKYLEESLRRHFPQFPILYPVEANGVFVQIPLPILKRLQEKTFFWIWDEKSALARLMTTWDTTKEFIDEFLSLLKQEIR